MYDLGSRTLYTVLSESWIADTPTDADQTAAINPNVSFPRVACAVVSSNVKITVLKAEVGTTYAK
jgi:hypothetical protein